MAHRKKTGAVVEIAPEEKKIDITPLRAQDGENLQEMVNLNNAYAGMLKQIQQYDAAITMLKIRRMQIQSGEIKLPVMIQVTRTLSYAESDKEKVLKHFDEEIKGLETAKQGVTGTLEYRKDAFVESLLRVSKVLSEKVAPFQIKKVVGIRAGSKDIQEGEQKALEKELDQMIASDKKV